MEAVHIISNKVICKSTTHKHTGAQTPMQGELTPSRAK